MAPPFPRKALSGQCGLCGDRLVRREQFGRLSFVHETTDSIRCAPLARVCTVCEKDGLVQCYDRDCLVIGHPGSCLTSCVCCGRMGCGAHVAATTDGLCVSCAAHGPVPDHEVEDF